MENTRQLLDTQEKKKFPIWILSIFVVITLSIGGYFWLSQKQPQMPTRIHEKVVIADASQPIGGLVHIAYKKGYFKKIGLDVTVQKYTSGRDALNAVVEGKANLATVAETPIMHAAMRAEKIYIITTIGTSEKNMAIIGRKDKGISTPDSIKGKKIGTSIGTNGEFFLDSFLVKQNLLRSEVDFVDLNPEEMLDALVNGKVNAVTIWNPHLIIIQKELGDKGITFYGEGLYTWMWNIAAIQEYVHENPKTIKKVLRALVEAKEYTVENPDESINVIADYIKMDRILLKELWNIYTFNVTLDQSLLITLEDQSRWVIRKHLSEEEVPNYLDYIYMDAIEEVKPEASRIIH